MTEEKSIASVMIENRVFNPPPKLSEQAYIKSMDQYKQMYAQSIADPEKFWAERAEELDWFKKWDKVLVEDFKNAKHEWFVGGKINVTYNCLDRHLSTDKKDKTALIWEGDIGDALTLTYQQLYNEVCKAANVLKKHGVKKGDRVSIYLPMIPELAITMMACARIGAIHSIIFGGFSAEALRDRIIDCESNYLICSDGYYRGGKVIASKANADMAMESCPDVKTCLVVKRAPAAEANMQAGRDVYYDEEMAADDISDVCEPEWMDSEDPLFILYTSGSTGKPKGVLHTQAGYLLYTNQTFKYVFDHKDTDIYWCTADIGWVTGHSYIVYGPLSLGATSIMFEGVPNYPKPDRFWEIVEKYKVTLFYTAPTAIRAIMRDGDDWPNNRDMSSIRILGSVGEPINPEAWMWYYEVIGKSKSPIVDTYWQTETGGFIITPFPGATPIKPGSASVPFFGVEPAILNDEGEEITEPHVGGWLVIKKPWPGLMRKVYGEEERFKNTYFIRFPGVYTTGDGCRLDEDGYYWLMGRIDDVINVSGHRIGTAEVESALVAHEHVAEAAVVGFPHEIKGQGIYAFVTLKLDVDTTDELKKELVKHVRKEIGPIATPDKIQFANALPKTRSGKIMRRILTKISAGDTELGDTSTLADPSVVDSLVQERV
ncbi:MAG: acetate--CoA ligase [Chloroflexi bacterium]|jgi:acetyl-CoA synthetase|nr:acetate--CoA ligase [Chloroflexota bacterium]